jgi:hypothetical protein
MFSVTTGGKMIGHMHWVGFVLIAIFVVSTVAMNW